MKGLPELSSAALDIGRDYDLHGVTPSVLITCRCAAKVPLLIVGMLAQATCPQCQKGYLLREVHTKDHLMHASIDVLTPHPVGLAGTVQ